MGNYIGENLRRLRERDGMSREHVARLLGVDAGEVAAWEDGRKKPDAESLGLLTRLFDVDIDGMLVLREDGAPPERVSDFALTDSVTENGSETHGDSVNNNENAGSKNEKGKNGADTGSENEKGKNDADTGSENAPSGTTPTRNGYIISGPLAGYIKEGEAVLWSGQPSERHLPVIPRAAAVLPMLLALVLTMLFMLWLKRDIGKTAYLIMLIIIIQAVGFITERIYLRVCKPCTYYAVTDRRILICMLRKDGSVSRYRASEYDDIVNVRLVESDDGKYGTVIFDTKSERAARGRRGTVIKDTDRRTRRLLSSLTDIADAGRVCDIINTIRNSKTGK